MIHAFSRLLGALCILGGSIGLGLWYKMLFCRRIRTLRMLENVLFEFESIIRYQREPLGQCFRMTASEQQGELRQALWEVGKRLEEKEEEGIRQVFCEKLEGVLTRMALTRSDRELFYSFLPENGYADVELQMNLLEKCRTRIGRLWMELEKENGNKCKMAVSLGVLGGLLLLLVLV